LLLNKDISVEENMKLKEALESDEKNAHESVKVLLRKYERYRVSYMSYTFSVLDFVKC